MKQFIYEVANSFYGKSIIGGMIGSVVHRLYNKMTAREFIGSIFVSAFVGLITGILLKEYTGFSEQVIYVGVSLSGNFAKYLLDEIKQIIQSISDIVINCIKNRVK